MKLDRLVSCFAALRLRGSVRTAPGSTPPAARAAPVPARAAPAAAAPSTAHHRLAQRWLGRCAATLALAAAAWPAISSAERQVLIDLYNGTTGDNWTLSNPMPAGKVAWKVAPGGAFQAAGTECTWYGILCDAAQAHVTAIYLSGFNLDGTLPANLNALTALQYFDVYNNQLTGAIPSLGGLTALQYFYVDHNQLTGSIPSLSGLTALQSFYASGNQLTGAIPSLSGLTALKAFAANNNHLTGSIPSLSGLTALQYFDVYNNHLTGSIPSLSGLTALESFYVNNNQLTGIPPATLGNLVAGYSRLCPNYLSPSADNAVNTAWDKATGVTPWSQDCPAAPSYTITVNAAPGTANPAAPSGGPGATPAIVLTLPQGQVVDQVSSTCGVVAGQPAAVTAGPLTSFTPLPLIGDCQVTVTYKAAPVATAVPTLGEWGLMLLGLLAAGLGMRQVRRRGPG